MRDSQLIGARRRRRSPSLLAGSGLIAPLVIMWAVGFAQGHRPVRAGAEDTITVAAAVSLKDALTAVADDYRKAGGTRVEFVFGSSGQLVNQIIGGAPIDLFVSAARKQVADLEREGLARPGSSRLVAGNSLVVVVPPDAAAVPTGLKDLLDGAYARIALGEPKTVPAGQYAAQALETYGIAGQLGPKLIRASNVRQVLDYVARGEVAAGFVYATDARLDGNRVRIAFSVDPSTHEPIVYPAVVVQASGKRDAAERFLNHVLSGAGRKRLNEFGFSAPPEPDSPAGTTAPAGDAPAGRPSQPRGDDPRR